mmetsp:Transcript_138986/g.387626  ORF Transcript_138986/g.387626 Transcript_138986/m.387626 type:complete len:252 (+) Transcript_138986:87-842(+)
MLHEEKLHMNEQQRSATLKEANRHLAAMEQDTQQWCEALEVDASAKVTLSAASEDDLERETAKEWEQRNFGDVTIGHWVATSPDGVERLVDFAAFTPTDVLLDVGCGNGALIAAVARQTGCRVVGIEINAELCVQAKELFKQNGVQNLATVLNMRAEQLDMAFMRKHKVTVVYLFCQHLQWQGGMRALLQQFVQEDHHRVVSHQFELPVSFFARCVKTFPADGSPDETESILDLTNTPIHFYLYDRESPQG